MARIFTDSHWLDSLVLAGEVDIDLAAINEALEAVFERYSEDESVYTPPNQLKPVAFGNFYPSKLEAFFRTFRTGWDGDECGECPSDFAADIEKALASLGWNDVQVVPHEKGMWSVEINLPVEKLRRIYRILQVTSGIEPVTFKGLVTDNAYGNTPRAYLASALSVTRTAYR